MPETTKLETWADQAEDYAGRDRRPWQKLVELCDEIEVVVEPAQQIVEAIEQLRAALDDKDAAMDEAPTDRTDSLAAAWDEAVSALEAITEAARELDAAVS